MTDTESAGRPGIRQFEIYEQMFTTLRTLIRVTGWCVVTYFAFSAFTSLSGQSTNVVVNATFSVLADFRFAATLTLAGASAIWAVVERSLRHHKVEKLQGRIRQLETKIDPGRTSSNLTPKGKTNPKDVRP